MCVSSTTTLALTALFMGATPLPGAAPIQFQSGATQTSLLELYTSEGCSSCPPAEAWLSRLKENPKLWKDFVPVAFHVDYWDYLGWKDPFASEAFVERQRAWADHWRSRSVYTPGFVSDGREWRGWANRGELPRASNKPVGTLTARSEDGRQWTLHFQPASMNGYSACDFHAALVGFNLASDVKAGENRGRKLQYDFVVLALAQTVSSRNGDFFQGELSLTLNPPPIAPKGRGFAAWVTPAKSLLPLQAVGGWLPSTKQSP